MRLPERPLGMEENGCGGIYDMKCSGTRKKENIKSKVTTPLINEKCHCSGVKQRPFICLCNSRNIVINLLMMFLHLN